MDSRAKQRLTGAVILVALFVLLVPELLTGPRKGGADAPSDDGMRHYTIDLDAPAGGTQPTTPATPAPAVALPPVAENPMSPADARAAPGESAQPESAATSPATSAAAAPRAATPPAATPPVATTPMAPPPQPVASAPAQSPAPATQKPATNPVAANPVAANPPASNRGGFAVQLGSFVSRDNAERLVREMTAKGFNAFLAPPITTGGRELYRVRVGPTRDRAAAEALATQLRRMGHEGSVVANS